MKTTEPAILFVDNQVNRVFKTVEDLRINYANVQVCSSEAELLESVNNSVPDIVFMNLDLQPNDAVVLTKELRKKFSSSPPFLIIYSDKQDDFVQELAFNSGVDSFISFHSKPSVMKVYIQNLLKRRVVPDESQKQKIMIDADKYLIFKYGEPLQLPRKEFRLFELLYNNRDKFFSKTEIAESIWHDVAVAKKRAIDVHIYNIRQIFGKRIIQSQKGKGYRMNRKAVD